MASGKRASMREGPLAALFRRTDEGTPEGEPRNDEATPAEQPRAEQTQLPEVPPATAAGRREEPRRQVPEQPPLPTAEQRGLEPRAEEPPAERRAAEPPPHPRESGYPHPSLGAHAQPEVREAPRVPTPQERLRHAFSSEIPDDIMAPPAPARPEPEPYVPAPDPYARSAGEPAWGAPAAPEVGKPIIRVVGVGGAGVNAVNRMVEAEVAGVEFLAINTDLQSLQQSSADVTLHIGPQVTRGLGAGSNPDLGRQAAMEEYDKIKALLKGSDMVFIAAGAGGGTGTGAAPIVARIAREVGALTVGIVTKPFGFEGTRRATAADTGIESLHEEVDTLIVVPNNRLLSVLDKHTSMVDAFRVADDVLRQGVQGVSDLVTLPGIINLDFADVRTIMSEAGVALLGIGMGHGDRRAIEAAEQAVSSPLLETSMDGARSILLSITGGADLSLFEVNEAAKAVAEAAHPDANIIFGAMVDEKLDDQVWVTVVATRYGAPKPRARQERRPLEEPVGEPRIERRTPARSPERAPRRAATELDVPEFLPRR
ncbi:MAG: cell division protein FtsZ [Solirubrobacterales bacterium]|nr:cell division protein FtsZ [Solirubrobacterales bacterium]